jgi:DNA-binding transcriptional ArsR family regulator
MNESRCLTSSDQLDAVFSALADPTRREILSRLAWEELSVTEIASPYQISQPAISKHLKVLEHAGLIVRKTNKQQRLAKIQPETLTVVVEWLDEFKVFWGASFDQLDQVLKTLDVSDKKE